VQFIEAVPRNAVISLTNTESEGKGILSVPLCNNRKDEPKKNVKPCVTFELPPRQFQPTPSANYQDTESDNKNLEDNHPRNNIPQPIISLTNTVDEGRGGDSNPLCDSRHNLEDIFNGLNMSALDLHLPNGTITKEPSEITDTSTFMHTDRSELPTSFRPENSQNA